MRYARAAAPLFALALAGPGLAAEALAPADEVAALFAGTFDNNAQASSDPKHAKAMRLVAVKVPKSRLGDGAPVLYVEEAPLSAPGRPTRQRFYRLESEGADVIARVFDPKSPARVRGRWRTPADLALLGEAEVVERSGCAVRLKRADGGWSGGSEGVTCPPFVPGARYAESDLRLAPGRVESWDRDYDAKDLQLVISPARPWVFERRSDGPPVPPAK